MGRVLSFPIEQPPEKKDPHIAGEACCPCGYSWAAVAPVGVVWLTCPKCGGERGLFKFRCVPDGLPIWHCVCDCSVFCITAEYIVCVSCGHTKPLTEMLSDPGAPGA